MQGTPCEERLDSMVCAFSKAVSVFLETLSAPAVDSYSPSYAFKEPYPQTSILQIKIRKSIVARGV